MSNRSVPDKDNSAESPITDKAPGIFDPVDEAIAESFPASDPPAFTPTHIGEPAEPLHDDSRKRRPA